MKKIFSYLKYRSFLDIFLLGVAAGIPIVLIMSTLTIWLKEIGVNKSTIGLFAIISTPYVLKFLWAPIIDGSNICFLSRFFDRRKSWLILVQVLLSLSIILLSYTNPGVNLLYTAIGALLIAFFSATQDIVIDAYRIEIFDKKDQGIAASLYIYGYRIGMLVSGAGALVLAELLGFVLTYFIIGLSFLGFAVYSISIKPVRSNLRKNNDKLSYSSWFVEYVYKPMKDFVSRKDFVIISVFIIVYKLGDAFAGIMTGPFLLELSFSKLEIAFYVKTYGLFATLLGAFIGGLLVSKVSLRSSLFIAAILQMVTNFIFCIQALAGYNTLLLSLTIGAENLAGGIGTVVFVAYLSNLCKLQFAATQYALFSALAGVARTWLSATSGFFADNMGWVEFFFFSALLALPGILLIKYLDDSPSKKNT